MPFDFELGERILINKPLTWTSFDAVNKLKRSLKIKKIGHAGTLDPLATGLLVICTGKLTKTIDSIQGAEKEYIFDILLGKTTPSIDLETDFNSEKEVGFLNNELVKNVVLDFKGELSQIPPMYSAITINGKRAYKLARKGVELEIPARMVSIYAIEILEINLPTLKVKITCSKGTYVRSLVRDIGEKLNCGACMTSLIRTRIGDFRLDDALSPEEFVHKVESQV